MQSLRRHGKLTSWNDDRGFGFIQPDDGGKPVFLHISTLPKTTRRPQVGDTIYYERTAQLSGKERATHAFIAGAASLPKSRRPRHRQRGIPALLALALLIAGFLYARLRPPAHTPGAFRLLPSAPAPDASGSPPAYADGSGPQEDSAPPPGYTIKGNISLNTGAKLYHLPGEEDYAATIIDPRRGERWFRTEAEAIAAGWRKAPR